MSVNEAEYFALQSTYVSISLSCLYMNHPTETAVVCCNPTVLCTWITALLSALQWGLLRLALITLLLFALSN